MKKFVLVASFLILTILTVACSASESSKLEKIYDNAMVASENLKNYALEMNIDQTADADSQNRQEISYKINGEFQTEPSAFHHTTEFEDNSFESYFTNQGMFVEMPSEGTWSKVSADVFNQINNLGQIQQPPAERLKKLEKYVSEFELEEQNGNYELYFSAKGKDLEGFLEEALKEMMPENSMNAQTMESTTLNKLTYKLIISKESYYPKSFALQMDMDIKENDSIINLQQDIKGTYSKYNEIEEIKVPKKVIKSAKELPF